MMGVVVIAPPGAADAHQEIAQDEPANHVPAASANDLLAEAVMNRFHLSS
jgi:hypothetical protein